MSNHFFRLWHRSAPVQALTISFFGLLFGAACFLVLNKFIISSTREKTAVGAMFILGITIFVTVLRFYPITIDLPDPTTEHEFRVAALGEKNASSHSDQIEIVEIKIDDQKVKLNSFVDGNGWNLSGQDSLISSGHAEINYVFEARQGATVTILFNGNRDSGMVLFDLDNQGLPPLDLYQQNPGQKIITRTLPQSTVQYVTSLILYSLEYIFIGFILFLVSFLIKLVDWNRYLGRFFPDFHANGKLASHHIFSLVGIILAGGLLLILAVSQIRAAFSSHYFAPMTNVEEAAYTYTSANNYIKYGFMNSLFLQDFSNSRYPEGHPYVYTHMPAGPDIFLALLLVITKGNYQLVRVIIVLLVLVGLYFYYFFSTLILSGLNLKGNAAGYAIALIGPWTLVRLMESQIYPLLPFLAFFPIFAMHKSMKNDRGPWLILFAFVSFLSSIYIEYSLLIGIVFCYLALYLTQLIRFEKKYIQIYVFAVTGGIVLHLIQNFLYFGPALFIRELSILLSNRITGYPTQEALFDFYHAISVVHHGAHPIDINTLLLQIASSLHLNTADRGVYLVLIVSIVINLLRKILPQANKEPAWKEILLPLPPSIGYFGGLSLWMGVIVLSPIFIFPAFAQEVNIGSFGGNFFFSIFAAAIICFSSHQLIQLLVSFYKNSLRISTRKDHFRASILTDYFALSFYRTKIKRHSLSLTFHKRSYHQWLLSIMLVALLPLNLLYVVRVVSHLTRFTVDQTRRVLDVQRIVPPEIDLDKSLSDLQQFDGQLFMTNINSPTVGFLVDYPGYGVCSPESISESGEIDLDKCSIEFIKPADIKTRSQAPKYFFYFSYPPLFPGFADCMPSNTMVGARGGDACMGLMKQHLSKNYKMVFENDTFIVFDLQQNTVIGNARELFVESDELLLKLVSKSIVQ